MFYILIRKIGSYLYLEINIFSYLLGPFYYVELVSTDSNFFTFIFLSLMADFWFYDLDDCIWYRLISGGSLNFLRSWLYFKEMDFIDVVDSYSDRELTICF